MSESAGETRDLIGRKIPNGFFLTKSKAIKLMQQIEQVYSLLEKLQRIPH